MNLQTHELTNLQTHELTNLQTHELTNSCPNKLTNPQTHKLTNSQAQPSQNAKAPSASRRSGLRIEKRRPPTLPHCIAVPSAQAGLTSLFGMGRGGTPPQ